MEGAEHESERVCCAYYRPVAAFAQAFRTIGETTAITQWIRLILQSEMDYESRASESPLGCQVRIKLHCLLEMCLVQTNVDTSTD